MRSIGKVWRDESGIIINWIVKIVVGTVIAGIIVYDLGSIAANFLRLDSIAGDIAIELSGEISPGSVPNQILLERTAKALAQEADVRLLSVEVTSDGKIVKVRIQKKASTLIVSRIGPIEDWGVAQADGQAGTT